MLFAVNAIAVEVSLISAEQIIRQDGKPVIYSKPLPAIAGEAKLIIQNGEEDGTKRINSALITVNGEAVVTQDNFNQEVGYLEVTIAVIEENTISVS